jgi:Domain of unknown function (DUF4032)
MPPRFQLVARTGHPDFLDLPWDRPLEELESERLVSVVRGIGRHVVRFVDYDGTLYALKELTGLRAQENQARRMLNDLATFRADLEKREGRPLPSSVITARWLEEVFESAIAAVPSELFGKREAAEIFHEILDHRWYLSQDAGRDVGLLPAVESYVERVLRHVPDERALLERDLEPEPT